MKLTSSTRLQILLVVLTSFIIYIPESSAAVKESIDVLLKKFEETSSIETANMIMDALYQEQFIDEPIRFSPQITPDSMRQQVFYWAGEWLYNQQKYEDARKAALNALPLFHPNNDYRADCLNLLAIIHVRLGDFSNAVHYAKQCLDMDLKSGDADCISSSMNTVAGIYMAANQPKEAEKYILGAIEQARRVDNLPRRAVIFGMASEIYHKLGDDNKALTYAEQAFSIDSLLNRHPQATIRLSQKGYALLGLKRYNEAEEVFREVLPILKNTKDQHSYAIVLNNMGSVLLKQDRPSDAICYYKEAAGILSDLGDLYNEIHSHRGLYESYWEIRPDSAKIELELFNLLKDSLYTHSTAESLSRYNAEFGNDQLQKENSEMRQAQKRTLIIALLLFIFIIVTAWLIIRYIRLRNQHRLKNLMAEIEKLHAKAEVTPKIEPTPQTESQEILTQEIETNDENKQFLKKVIEAVNAAMISGNINVEQIASTMNMGEQSFRRRLQSAAGETPKAFFTAIRMDRASNLLAGNPEIPISKVAELCGFENVSSFGHAFKRMYDCSPSQYRENSLTKQHQ